LEKYELHNSNFNNKTYTLSHIFKKIGDRPFLKEEMGRAGEELFLK